MYLCVYILIWTNKLCRVSVCIRIYILSINQVNPTSDSLPRHMSKTRDYIFWNWASVLRITSTSRTLVWLKMHFDSGIHELPYVHRLVKISTQWQLVMHITSTGRRLVCLKHSSNPRGCLKRQWQLWRIRQRLSESQTTMIFTETCCFCNS